MMDSQGTRVSVRWTSRNATFAIVALLDVAFALWLVLGTGGGWRIADLLGVVIFFGVPLIVLLRGALGCVVAEGDELFVRNPLRTYRISRERIAMFGLMSPRTWWQAAPQPVPCARTTGGRYVLLSCLAAPAMGAGGVDEEPHLEQLRRWLRGANGREQPIGGRDGLEPRS